ncbi:MAG TPA: deoxyribodipyrimidine photo-lyase, partial [Duganella sp.]|uniref:deoxyribodipyrimidine photo-lyase n=1 Tax=Duganella sp. TaxID=1904440 RepID=UPI002ED60AF0
MKLKSSLVWLRRDLRVFDHVALNQALQDSATVYCVFVYDTTILDALPRRDRRVDFIHASLAEVADELRQLGGHLIVRHADPVDAIPALAAELGVDAVFCNHDYEPQAIARDAAVAAALQDAGRQFLSYRDQVIFEKSEVLSQTGGVFSVFTPYKNAWLKKLAADPSVLAPYHIEPHAARLAPPPSPAPALPTLAELGFEPSNLGELKIP